MIMPFYDDYGPYGSWHGRGYPWYYGHHRYPVEGFTEVPANYDKRVALQHKTHEFLNSTVPWLKVHAERDEEFLIQTYYLDLDTKTFVQQSREALKPITDKLQENIDKEAQERQTEDARIRADLANEATKRQAEDEKLQNNIDAANNRINENKQAITANKAEADKKISDETKRAKLAESIITSGYTESDKAINKHISDLQESINSVKENQPKSLPNKSYVEMNTEGRLSVSGFNSFKLKGKAIDLSTTKFIIDGDEYPVIIDDATGSSFQIDFSIIDNKNAFISQEIGQKIIKGIISHD